MTDDHGIDTTKLNDEWEKLVTRSPGLEIDVGVSWTDLIDPDRWKRYDEQFTTRASAVAMPADYELTVRPVSIHILGRRIDTMQSDELQHFVYNVDEQSIVPAVVLV